MIVDVHAHVRFSFDEVDEMVKAAKRFDIEKIVVSRVHFYKEDVEGYYRNPEPEMFVEGNRMVYECMRRHPGTIFGLAFVNPLYTEESVKEIEACVKELGMVGVKLHVECLATDSHVFPIIEKCIELDVPILHHAWLRTGGKSKSMPNESTPFELAELAIRYPDATFQMAHLGGNWEVGVKAMKDLDNVYVDTCGGEPALGAVEMAVEELGAKRVLFGTDAPVRIVEAEIAKVLAADISSYEKKLILEDNARRIINLG